ncbi:hypothetical protein LAZ67_13002109 [Cordylochernes scorpioides]|uniref:CCHC-type domain-containing protein n=1 Tax=Cordylochernes scorpioides TaxID=51811 RepID=A0ABY6L6V9_9ARAC|nr:hypothetical protein LAZ67_13002109 [Cordylochernes scorpioides]
MFTLSRDSLDKPLLGLDLWKQKWSARLLTGKSAAVMVLQQVEASKCYPCMEKCSTSFSTNWDSYGTVWRALIKIMNKIQRFHELKVSDFEKCQEFPAWVFWKINIDENWVLNILWTDQIHFSLNGQVITQNSHIWTTGYPIIFTETTVDKLRDAVWCIFQGLISTSQLVERLDRYPLRNKRKIDSVEPEETSMNVKKEGTQVSNYVVQHLPRNPSIFSGEDGEDLQKWLKGYARVARYNHWDETLCLTKVYFYLSGTALKWFENNEESIQTWKEFTSQLENVFGKKENSKLQVEKKLKTWAQLKGESTEFYIQDVLCLCKEVDPQMSEEDEISHLMKGIAEELYQALLPRDVQSTEQFITECRRVEALRCRRVTPTRYERLPNVASLCDQDDGEDLSSMIRQIVREEALPLSSPPQKERPRQFLNTRYEAETIRPHPEPRYPKQGGRRDTNDWRTTEGRPICFYCGRPGHVVRYCRDRKRHNEERRNDYFQRKQDAMVSYNSRAESQDPNDESSRKTFTRYRSPTSYRGRNRQHFSPARRSSWTPRH